MKTLSTRVYPYGMASEEQTRTNCDSRTVEGFGDEWSAFDQRRLDSEELQEQFDAYFRVFPWDRLPAGAVGFDMGCGSGRWDRLLAGRVGKLYCIDASLKALKVAKRNLRSVPNCEFLNASVGDLPLADDSMDFGVSLGVLHHIPDTAAGIRACVRKLKDHAPFLLYIYYAFDNRPWWFRMIWRISAAGRHIISRLPFPIRYVVTQIIAAAVYFPLARTARLLEKTGRNVDAFPLSFYRRKSFYTMRTDALDRFGTRLEQRFTADQIRRMMEEAGLEDIRFSDSPPYWCAVGYRKKYNG